MMDPVKSILIDAEEFWNNMNIGTEVTTRDIYRAICTDKKFETHKLNALGKFLNDKVKYQVCERIGESVSDPRFKRIATETVRPINKRFCDVLNSSFSIGEAVVPTEFSLRYKNMHPKSPITKNYILKLLFALERHKCLKKVERGVYAKIVDIAEHEMTNVTRFIKIQKDTPEPAKIPEGLKAPEGITVVEILKLEAYIKEIRTLKQIVLAQRKEIIERDKIISNIPVTNLPDLVTTGYADLKQKYNIT